MRKSHENGNMDDFGADDVGDDDIDDIMLLTINNNTTKLLQSVSESAMYHKRLWDELRSKSSPGIFKITS